MCSCACVGFLGDSLGKSLPATRVPFPTIPDVIRTGVRPIVPRSNPPPVQPFSTIISGQTPFSYDGPGWGCTEVSTRVAGGGEVVAP